MIAAEKNSRRSHLTINDRFATVRIAIAVTQILLLLTVKFGLPKHKIADLTNCFLYETVQTNTFSTRSE